MDPHEEMRMAAILAAADRDSGVAPVPRPGRNREFDDYVQETFGDVDPENADVQELRRAAWRTWKTVAPLNSASASSHLNRADDDDELARALALSAQEHQATQGASKDSAIVIDDDDEEIQQIIAMSTAESHAPQRREGTPDEERRMMEEAIAASLAAEKAETSNNKPQDDTEAAIQASLDEERERARKRQKLSASPQESSAGPPRDRDTRSSTLDALGSLPEKEGFAATSALPGGLQLAGLKIDRAQLERERLARQAARKGTAENIATTPEPSSSAPAASASSSRSHSPKVRPSSATPSSSAAGVSFKSTSSNEKRTLPPPLPRTRNHPLQSTGPFPRDAAGEYYLDGELRHVSLKIGKPSAAPTFSPNDVFGDHSQMSLLIISSFCWDNPWIDEKAILPTPDIVPTVRICRPAVADFNEKRGMQGKLQIMADGEVRSYPFMDGRQGSEHMKFAWIFYKTGRLRVAVMTCNMVDYDWDQIENTVFIQDFLPTASRASQNSTLPDLPDQFCTLFKRLKIPKALKFLIGNHPFGSDIPLQADPDFASLRRYDWSRAKVRIVMSVSGKVSGEGQMEEYGLGRLSKIVREEGWTPRRDEKLQAEYQGSSLGTYKSKWLNDFYNSCCGKDMYAMARFKDDKSLPPIKVIFPSLATVDASINGRPGGGTMFCGSGFSSETASLFHDANSKCGGVLMHTKMLICLFEPRPQSLGLTSSTSSGKRKAEDEDNDVGGWVYVGSHNFSQAAWGTLNFTNKPPTLNITNYELGIVFPLSRENASAQATSVAAHQRPARHYGPNDVPWSQKQHMEQ